MNHMIKGIILIREFEMHDGPFTEGVNPMEINDWVKTSRLNTFNMRTF